MKNPSSQDPQPQVGNLPTLVAGIDLHPEAQKRHKEFVDDFANVLLLQSKTLALAQKADVVLSTHVENARKIALSREQNTGRLREILLIVGSGMMGTFLQGFPTEMATEPIRKNMIIFNVCMGILGAVLVFRGRGSKS